MSGLAQHVCEALFNASTASQEDIEALQASGQMGILYSEDGLKAISKLIVEDDTWTVSKYPLRFAISDWRYREITLGTEIVAEIAQIPTTITEAPPSKVERLLVRAWNKSDDLVNPDSKSVNRGQMLCLWSDHISGTPELKNFLVSSFNGVCTSSSATILNIETATHIVINPSSIDRKGGLKKQLLVNAVLNFDDSSKFQSLYRILENCYLDSLLSRVVGAFTKHPEDAFNIGLSDLRDERKMLVGLIIEQDLQTEFEEIQQTFKELVANSNRYANALEREIHDRKPATRRELWDVGAHIVYQIRCSIVHSRTGCIIENYRDSADVLGKIIPLLERTACKVTGVSVVET